MRMQTASFTLIELMLVVIIIAILTATVAPRLTGKAERARQIAAKADINANIPSALDLYEMDIGNYPSRLEELVQESYGASNWNGPYLKKSPKDPWARDYYYQYPGEHGQDYDLVSFGKDGVLGSEDDITNWE